MSIIIKQVTALKLHQGSIYSLDSNGNYFYSGGSEGIVARWDLSELNRAAAAARVNGQIFSLLFIAEKNHLIIGTMSGGIHVIDLTEKKEIHNITFHQQSVFDLKLHGQKIFACS